MSVVETENGQRKSARNNVGYKKRLEAFNHARALQLEGKPVNIAQIAADYGVGRSTLYAWLQSGPKNPNGNQSALSAAAEKLTVFLIQGWNTDGVLPTSKKCRQIGEAVAELIDNNKICLSRHWFRRFKEAWKLENRKGHTHKQNKANSMTVEHADMLEREFERALDLLNIDKSTADELCRIYNIDEKKTKTRWDHSSLHVSSSHRITCERNLT